MVFLRLGEDEDVINEDDHKVVEIGAEHVVHCLHETSWCVRQAKGHDLELIMPVPSGEGGFLDILLSNSNLMIARLQVNFRENLCSLQLIKQILNTREWILVFDSDLVEATIINTQAQTKIFLGSEEHRCAPFGHTLSN